MGLGERLTDALHALFAGMGNQLGGTFLLPGSTFSFAALGVTLGVFVFLVVRGRGRAIRPAVLWRVLVPRRTFGTASGRADFVYFWLGILFAGFAIGWALVSADFVRETILPWLGRPLTPRLPLWASMAITTPALYLAYELAYWLDHCLKHKVAFFWHFHKVHHQAESLSLFTNGRVHPVDTIVFANIVALVGGCTQALLVKLFGVPAQPFTLGGTNLIAMLAAVALTHLQHSHLWVGATSRWVLGPAHHQIHHSRSTEHYDRNLGNTLTIFDRLFGTYFQPGAARPADLRFGVEDGAAAPHGWRAATVQPFLDAAQVVARPFVRHGEAAVRPAAIPHR